MYTVKPENKEGPLRTLYRDLLLPCGHLPTEDRHPLPQSTKRRLSSRVNPFSDESVLLDEEEDKIIPIYWFRDSSSIQVPTFESIAQSDPGEFPKSDP